MTEQQQNLVNPILETITDDEIRTFAVVLLEVMPDYIWQVPASSTGKYHPAYSLGEGGLMRHQLAVVRFLNFFFELEQFKNEFTSKEMDLMRVAGLVHDSRKSGRQEDFEKNKYTKFEHPIMMANVVRDYKDEFLDDESIEFIAHCIESHMGQFNTDKKSSTVLPKPTDKYQQIVHLADYLASRKDLTMDFEGYTQPKPELPDLNTYVISFGKHSGSKLIDLWNTHKDYVLWCKENVNREPLQSLIKQLEKQEEDEI